jgi:hypothetical protein
VHIGVFRVCKRVFVGARQDHRIAALDQGGFGQKSHGKIQVGLYNAGVDADGAAVEAAVPEIQNDGTARRCCRRGRRRGNGNCVFGTAQHQRQKKDGNFSFHGKVYAFFTEKTHSHIDKMLKRQ